MRKGLVIAAMMVACGGSAETTAPSGEEAPKEARKEGKKGKKKAPAQEEAASAVVGTIDGKEVKVVSAFAYTEPKGRVQLIAYDKPLTCEEYLDVATRKEKAADALYLSFSIPGPAGSWTLPELSGDDRKTGNAGVFAGLNGGLGGTLETRSEGSDVVADFDVEGMKMDFDGTVRFVGCSKG